MHHYALAFPNITDKIQCSFIASTFYVIKCIVSLHSQVVETEEDQKHMEDYSWEGAGKHETELERSRGQGTRSGGVVEYRRRPVLQQELKGKEEVFIVDSNKCATGIDFSRPLQLYSDKNQHFSRPTSGLFSHGLKIFSNFQDFST